MRTPRITMLTTSFPRFADDDASIFILRIVEALSQKGIGGEVIVPLDANEPPNATIGLFSIKRYRYGLFKKGALAFGAGIMPNLRSRRSLVSQIPLFLGMMSLKAGRALQKDSVLHAQWLASGVAAWAVHLFTRKPYIISLLGEDAKLIKSAILRPLLRPVLRSAAAVTAVNSAVLRDLQTNFSLLPERCHFISTGVAVPKVLEEEIGQTLDRYGLEKSRPFLLSVARVIPLKGIHHLIRLIAEPALSKLDLVVAGGSEDAAYVKSLTEQAQALGVAARVHLIGRARPRDIPALLQGAAAFASASSYEGRPNAVMESLAAGCVTLVSNIPPHIELVTDGKSGLVVQIEDAPKSAERLASILGDATQIEKMRLEAVKSMAENSWEACADAFIQVYQSVLRR